MTRRIQYRGGLDEEWASYGPETRAIASAFVRGINAWVAIARERPPAAFVLAGWGPEFWRPEDLLNRTDAFLASGDAHAEVFRARLVTAVGVARAQALLGRDAPAAVPPGFDLATISFQVGDAVAPDRHPPLLHGDPGSGRGQQRLGESRDDAPPRAHPSWRPIPIVFSPTRRCVTSFISPRRAGT